mmetsp:Transcript_23981/g.58609  ORF Transcript_23981/g.58609 Transcript_23981/m.58609 type:complete len:1038 (+) Transcript_23981:129-3242(+)
MRTEEFDSADSPTSMEESQAGSPGNQALEEGLNETGSHHGVSHGQIAHQQYAVEGTEDGGGTEDKATVSEHAQERDDEKEKKDRKSRKRSSRRSNSNNYERKAFDPYGDNGDSERIRGEDEQHSRRDHLRSQKRSSSRKNMSKSKSSRRHLTDSSDGRSERQLTRESSRRRHKEYERQQSHRSSSSRSKHTDHRPDDYRSDSDDDDDSKYRRARQDDMEGHRSNSAGQEIEHSRERHRSRRSKRSLHSRQRSLSEHREDSRRRSGIERQHRSKRRLDEQRSPSMIPPILPAASSQTQATSQFSDMESPQSKTTKKRKRKQGKRRSSMFSTRNLCCGCCFISIIVGVVVTVIVLQKRVVDPATLPKSFEQPSSADCAAISKGTFVTPKKGSNDAVSTPRRFQINMQVEMNHLQEIVDDDDDSNNAEMLSSVKNSMQTHLMPILADCPASTRRLSRIHPENRRTLDEALPQYIISNGVVVNVIMNPTAIADQVGTSQQRSTSRYLVVVLVDIWLQDDAKDDLIIKKVLESFDKLDKAAIFPSHVQIAESALSVQPISTLDEVTAFPTVSPTMAASKTPTEVPTQVTSRSPTKVSSLNPSAFPSVSPSPAPTGLPSVSPSRLPSSEPSEYPSTQPSSIPTLSPTSSPTREPTLSPTPRPTTPPTIATTKTNISVDRSVDVVIVGAGAAGLTAAYHLEQQGLSVVVLEAANRYGGRMKQDNTWDVSMGLGPEWLHVDDPNEMLSRIVGRTVNKRTINEPNLAHRWTGTTLEYNPPGSNSGDYRWMDGTWWDFFDQELASNLQANTIVLNSLVQKIDYEYEKPVVFLTDGRRYEGSYVIVTASVRTLQLGEINFVPSLPSSHIDAINSIEMDITVKVFMEFTEKFYPEMFALQSDRDDYSSSCGSSNHGLRLFYDPTVGRTTSTNILGMFTYANIADLYTDQEDSVVIRTLLDLLDDIFNGRASQTFVKGVVQDWANEPHIRTAYTKYGSSRYRETLRDPIDNKLYFAGEAVRTSGAGWGYVHGAAYCGKDVAEEIIDRIRG